MEQKNKKRIKKNGKKYVSKMICSETASIEWIFNLPNYHW